MTDRYTDRVLNRKSVVGTMEVDPWVLDALEKKGRAPNTKNTHCGNGHEFVEGSFRLEKDIMGYTRRRCLKCDSDARNRHRANMPADLRAKVKERDNKLRRERHAAKKLGISVQEYRANNVGDTEIKKHPVAYLTTTPEEGKAQDRVNYAVDHRGRPPCEADPDAYYFDEPVSTQVAEKLCAGCPLMVECLDRMKYSIPIEGAGYIVAGGRVLGAGKMLAK